mgnify:FL=1
MHFRVLPVRCACHGGAVTEEIDPQDPRLIIRRLTSEDVDAMIELQQRCFPSIAPWERAHVADHLARFPAGQIGVELDGALVASSSYLVLHSKSSDD